MTDSPEVQEFWQVFLRSGVVDLPADATYHEAFMFGGGGELADECAAAVLAGKKTTTSALLWEVETFRERGPLPGDLSIVMTSDGTPVCVIETIAAPVMPFNTVDEQFAFDYGEGERTLAWWRTAMWDYYVADCAEHGWTPSPEMPLICERFRVVYRG